MTEISTNPPLPVLPPRKAESHKGDYGRALLVGGSVGMAGSISLAGMACLRSGAGLVTLAVPELIVATVASFEPSYMTLPLPCDAKGRLKPPAVPLWEFATGATCMAIGPGMGQSPAVQAIVRETHRFWPQPLVCDADALNALAEARADLAIHAGPRILTPHPGEFRRLTNGSAAERATLEAAAIALAANTKTVIVLKGHHTLVTDGGQCYRNTTGNPGMATGGVGDVLTGVITALVCQGLAPFAAAQLGVYTHGLAGDLAAVELGEISLTASDLIDYLPAAWRHRR